MSVRYVCANKACRASITVKPGVRDCPECNTAIPRIMWVDTPKQAKKAKKAKGLAKSNKAAKRKAAKAQVREVDLVEADGAASFAAVLRRDGAAGWRLLIDGQLRRVVVEGRPAAEFLEEMPCRWVVTEKPSDGSALRVRPVDSKAVREALARNDAADRAAAARPRPDTELRPPRRGKSHLERYCEEHTLAETAREIRRLAQDDDTPRAWRALANGWRVEKLREAIREAMLDVGVERIQRFVLEGPYRDEWEPDLIAWLEEEAHKRAKRVQTFSKVRVIFDDDYGVMDY